MKNIIKIFSPLALISVLSGCFNDPGTDTVLAGGDAFVEIEEVSAGGTSKVYNVVPDGAPVEDNVTIGFGGITPASDITVTFEVVTAESTAIEGVDFELVSPGTVTIPAGSFTAPLVFTVNDDILDPDADPKTLTLRITGSSVGQVNPNYEKVTLTLVGICPGGAFDYAGIPGTYDVITNASSTDGCPPSPVLSNFASTATITYVSGDVASGAFEYTIEDSFGGTYIEWYGDCYGYNFETDNNFTVDVETGAVSGDWTSAFGESFEVTGSLDFCNGVLTLSWVNNFGDEAVTVINTLE